ncbi:hypothetical protein [Pseudovibrio sp. Alg231-02]|uniref:hypothetical protein n=1 Tax=Pseudovibrio sp. Alg231-02 TaxID=1922223 RepID=UPI00131F16AD|nr:hypothetical protein [Pseudovibrio sp. Alg231-02]
MFSRKTRKGLLGGVALALAGVMAGEAGAANGVLITTSFCDRFTNSRNLIWSQDQLGTDNVFYMRADGQIYQLEGNTSFKDLEKLVVSTHGNCNQIAGMTTQQFATRLNTARVGQTDSLKRVLFFSCKSAAEKVGTPDTLETDSILSVLKNETRFSNTGAIIGWILGGYFAGAGSSDFSSAKYTTGKDFEYLSPDYPGGVPLAKNAAKYLSDFRLGVLDNLWSVATSVSHSGKMLSIGAFCEQMVQASAAAGPDDVKKNMNAAVSASNKLLRSEYGLTNDKNSLVGWTHQYLGVAGNSSACGADVAPGGNDVRDCKKVVRGDMTTFWN